MHSFNRFRLACVCFAAVVVLTGPGCSPADAQRSAEKGGEASSSTKSDKGHTVRHPAAPTRNVEPLEFGGPFPSMKMTNLNPGSATELVDLDEHLGKRPVLFVYWIPGNPRAEEFLQQVIDVVDSVGSDKLATFGLVFPNGEGALQAAQDRSKALDLKIPVLNDVGFQLGQKLLVRSVPFVAIVDGEGKLQLANGSSLVQEIEYKLNLDGAIRRVATTGKIGNHGYLPRWYPVQELVGQRCPDFTAPQVDTMVERRWHSVLDQDKLNVLIFWSVDCPHCRESLPEINAWLKANPDGINVYSSAHVDNASAKSRTKEFCEVNEFVFPTLVDQQHRIMGLYQITSTPTILFIKPDGVIDSVMLSGIADFGSMVERKKRELL
ncbi:MAG: redoxin domain-containing protein [bacterium]|nr:redoxin domain-containing protein [bacterium]